MLTEKELEVISDLITKYHNRFNAHKIQPSDLILDLLDQHSVSFRLDGHSVYYIYQEGKIKVLELQSEWGINSLMFI